MSLTPAIGKGLSSELNTPKKPEPPRNRISEKSLARLEEVVRRLESPQLALDEAMKLFEKAGAFARMPEQLEERKAVSRFLLKRPTANCLLSRSSPKRASEKENHS